MEILGRCWQIISHSENSFLKTAVYFSMKMEKKQKISLDSDAWRNLTSKHRGTIQLSGGEGKKTVHAKFKK